MNKLISKVSPLTTAIIWLTSQPINSNTESYKAVDYLLNGLLTSSVNANPDLSSRVLIGEQFGKQLHIYIAHDVRSSDVKHFLRLIEDKTIAENNIILIDDIGQLAELQKFLSPSLKEKSLQYL